MIRVAALADVPKLLELAQLEHAASRLKDKPFDRTVASINLQRAIDGMLTRIWLSDSGFLAGMLQPALFNREFIAYELVWYAQDGCGMQLLEAFCQWARDMRAADVVISNYAGIKDPDKFARVIKRAGFSPLGATYTKSMT